MIRAALAALLLAGCWTSSAPDPATPAIEAPSPRALRVSPPPPVVGHVWIETSTIVEGGREPVRQVSRHEVVAVDGMVITRQRTTFLEHEDDLLRDTTFDLWKDGATIHVLVGGSEVPDHVRTRVLEVRRSFGRQSDTQRILATRTFRIGQRVELPLGTFRSMPADVRAALTLRAIDRERATFDVELTGARLEGTGTITVDTRTGLDVGGEMEVRVDGRVVRTGTYEARTER